ncbi:MAG: DNA/RNA non-specific endonuclease [Rikenellaceae bacterium]
MIKYIKILAISLWALMGVMACGSSGDDSSSATITLSSEAVSASQTTVTATLRGAIGAEWSGEISDPQGFVSFNISDSSVTSKEGTIGESGVSLLYIYITSNTTEDKRNAEVTITLTGAKTETFTITQQSNAGSPDSDDTSTLNFDWAELPEQFEDANYQYVVHYTTLNSKLVRNFSMCYDKKNYAARWVAFPYHTSYDGGVGRNEEWEYDPKIDEQYQPNLSKSYSSYNGGSYDRGHQLASGDRQATVEMNEQTFYYSNMTPQLGTLNQQMWATFETNVRKQLCADTLYVVTGADYSTTIGSTTDADGKACPIPRGYYKVLLRTISGNSGKAISECDASELKAIGYYFDHQYYSSMPNPKSVAEIEALVGFIFFPTAPESVKQSYSSNLWFF